MAYYNKNPLNVLSQKFDMQDYYLFRDHLQVPRPYLAVALKNFSPFEAIKNLALVIRKYHEYLWRKELNPSLREKFYVAANIPPQYTKQTVFICEKATDQSSLDYILNNSAWIDGRGKQFYFYGPFCDEPLKAATTLMKRAIDAKIPCWCDNYPQYMEHIFDKDGKEKLSKFFTCKVLVLWGVGSEHTADFQSNKLKELLEIRETKGLTTVVVSSLTPTDFGIRYKMEPPGIVVGFKGAKIKETLSMLKEEIGRGL